MLKLYILFVDRFPFDKMECKMTFSLIIQQALRVKLEPKCQWNVPIDKANQKVSILNSLWKRKLIYKIVNVYIYKGETILFGTHNWLSTWNW